MPLKSMSNPSPRVVEVARLESATEAGSVMGRAPKSGTEKVLLAPSAEYLVLSESTITCIW